MIAFAARSRTRWSDYDRVAKHTPQGLGIHAPCSWISTSARSCRCRSSPIRCISRAPRATRTPLTAAELELMNLTGDGNGIDMVMMPEALREQVPTANFFQPNGYARNPVARRTRVVAGLIAEIQATSTAPRKRRACVKWRRRFSTVVVTGHSRSKNGVSSKRLCPGDPA